MRTCVQHVPATLSINELSALIARHNAIAINDQHRLADILPPPTEELAQVFAEMRAAGYVVGEPIKFAPSRKRSYTEWHVPASKDGWSGMLAFFVEVQAC